MPRRISASLRAVGSTVVAGTYVGDHILTSESNWSDPKWIAQMIWTWVSAKQLVDGWLIWCWVPSPSKFGCLTTRVPGWACCSLSLTTIYGNLWFDFHFIEQQNPQWMPCMWTRGVAFIARSAHLRGNWLSTLLLLICKCKVEMPWSSFLDGSFKDFLFIPIPGAMIPVDQYVSNGWLNHQLVFCLILQNPSAHGTAQCFQWTELRPIVQMNGFSGRHFTYKDPAFHN